MTRMLALVGCVLAVVAVAGLSCGPDGPCELDDCPASVNCQPSIPEENQCMCAHRDWTAENCPDTEFVE
jgi:hypothetical protein